MFILYEGRQRECSTILVTERRAWCTSSQPAGDVLEVSPSSRVPLLSARPAVISPAKERNCSSTSTKLYCLVTETHKCEQLVQGCYVDLSQWELNPLPIDQPY